MSDLKIFSKDIPVKDKPNDAYLMVVRDFLTEIVDDFRQFVDEIWRF